MPNPPPTAGSEVDLSRPNKLKRYKQIASVLGVKRFHEWQETWLAGASEENDDGTRRRHRCGLMLGRQGGKSEMIPTVAFEAACSGRHVGYTAQNRSRAAEKWRGWVERWMAVAPKQWRGKAAFSLGAQVWKLPEPGGSFRLLTPDGSSPRGPTLDEIICDESAWVPRAFLDAASGTLSTRPEWAIYEFCTAPDERKAICAGFAKSREDGLASLAPDAGPELDEWFWQEWSAQQMIAAGAHPCSDEVLERAIPTLDSVDPPGVARAFIRSEWEKYERRGTPEVFLREYLSVPTKPPEEARFDMDAWEKCAAAVEVPMGAVVSVDFSPGRDAAAIAAAYAHTSDDVIVEIIASMQGTGWVVPKLLKVRQEHPHSIGRIVLDDLVAGNLAAELMQRGFWVEKVGYREYGRYFAAFNDLVQRKGLRQRPHPALDAAVQSASVRKLGEGSAWDRRSDAESPICPLVAATLAVGAAQEMPAPDRLVM